MRLSLRALFLCAAFLAFPCEASALEPSVIAIVDVQRILQDSKAAASVRQQLEHHRSKFQTEVGKEEDELRQAEKNLIKLREEEKREAFVEEEQKLQQRFLKVERHVQARRKALDQALTESMNKVRQALIDVVSALATEKGYTLVVVKQQVIWNASATDITQEVLVRLDKAMPNIPVRILSDEEILADEPVVIKGPDKRAP